jgi:acetolactate synthase-1/2/3 large subunit
LANPDFAALARAYGCWADTVETTGDFAPALHRAQQQRGVRMLHVKTDIEVITAGTTLGALKR